MKHNPGFLKLVQQAKKNIKEYSVFRVKKKLDRGEAFYFIDVREDHEFQKRYARGALHLGRGSLSETLISGFPIKILKLSFIVEEDIVRRWRPII